MVFLDEDVGGGDDDLEVYVVFYSSYWEYSWDRQVLYQCDKTRQYWGEYITEEHVTHQLISGWHQGQYQDMKSQLPIKLGQKAQGVSVQTDVWCQPPI